ncbi:MAG: sporulation protein YtfJ [Firmicutes bacterium]|nr:sporulation protein YtfJ [Candidatus Fermentithermobacillaceae bacterium]
MSDHPIESLMKTTMESLKAMVDVNTVVGEPVQTEDGTVIVPVSRVSFGFVAGGGDEVSEEAASGQGWAQQNQGLYSGQSRQGQSENEIQQTGHRGSSRYPFAGGSGAGVTIKPVAFLVVGGGQVRVLPVDGRAIYDRLLDAAPVILEKLADLVEPKKGDRRKAREEAQDMPGPAE